MTSSRKFLMAGNLHPKALLLAHRLDIAVISAKGIGSFDLQPFADNGEFRPVARKSAFIGPGMGRQSGILAGAKCGRPPGPGTGPTWSGRRRRGGQS